MGLSPCRPFGLKTPVIGHNTMKLILWIGGRPQMNGLRRRAFQWVPNYGCYIYEGKEIDGAEFNAKYEEAQKHGKLLGLTPNVKVVSLAPSVSAVEPPTPVATITVAREITAEEAEEIMQRLAPERLKGKPGRKPHVAAA